MYIKLFFSICVICNMGIVQAQQVYQQIVGGSNNELGYGVSVKPDGGIVFSGITGTFSSSSSGTYVVNIDSNGTILWKKSYEAGTNTFELSWNTSVKALNDNTILVGGYSDEAPLTSKYFSLMKINATNGIPVWAKNYGSAGHDRLNNIQVLPNGNLLLVGQETQTGSGNGYYKLYVMEADSLGNLLWSTLSGGSGLEYGYSGTVDDAGNVYAVGFSNSYSFIGDYDVRLTKLDSIGQVLWTKIYGGGSDDKAYSIKFNSSGNLVIAGITASMGAGSNDIFVLEVDTAGTQITNSVYGTSGDDGVRSMEILGNDDLLLGGWSTGLSTDGLLLGISSNGAINFAHTYGGSGIDKFYSLSASGSVVGLCGVNFSAEMQPSSLNDMYMVGTDIYGYTTCYDSTLTFSRLDSLFHDSLVTPVNLSLGIENIFTPVVTNPGLSVAVACISPVTAISENANYVSAVWPNPVADELNVSLGIEQKAEVRMTDLAGRIIDEWNVENMITTISTDKLKSGIYFLTISFPNHRETYKIIKR